MRKLLVILVVNFLIAFGCYAGVLGGNSFFGGALPLKGVWISQNTIAINDYDTAYYRYFLQLHDGTKYSLENVGYFDNETQSFHKKFDYVVRSGYGKFFIDISKSELDQIIKGPITIVKQDLYSNRMIDQFSLSLTGVLDELYSYDGDKLGLSFDGHNVDFRLWSPTAIRVALHLYRSPDVNSEIDGSPIELSMNDENVWHYSGRNLKGLYYRYEIESFKRRKGQVTINEVTDLYSVNLSMNSEFSQVIDVVNDIKPSGWDNHTINRKYPVKDFADISLYELHVRDFSYFDFTQPKSHRGKFLAFTNKESNGVRHLNELANSGVTHVHLLPVNDQATIDENPENRADLSEDDYELLSDSLGSGDFQQGVATRIRKLDGFNWGYDPIHYQALEGSYSTNPNSASRIREFRQMVMSFHSMGLGVVIDTVFNHYDGKKNLDHLVPDYYYSLSDCGDITQDSCCPDLATENKMTHKLIVDSAINMVKWYRLDGIRFDLMGFITKSVMAEIRQKLDKLTLEKDGVDGKLVFMYGEGWNFGPLLYKLPAEAATQWGAASLDMGIASFNDRFRDAVKGKGQNADDLFVDDAFVTDKVHDRERVLMGLMGSLKGVKGGYVNDPAESINYITAHDKATLWDTLAAKIGPFASTDQMVRVHQLALSTLTFAQGVPFYHAGVEILRSKSGDENSYDSGDWFNKIDFSYRDNGWRDGLPPSWISENLKAWGGWEYRLSYVSSPLESHIKDTFEHFKDIQKIRRSSKLFRLSTKEQVLEKVSLPANIYNEDGNFDSRLVVLKLDDREGSSVDPNIDTIWVAFNSSWDECLSFEDEDLNDGKFQVHPVLKQSKNRFTRDALNYYCGNERFSGQRLWIPPQSTLVYYKTAN